MERRPKEICDHDHVAVQCGCVVQSEDAFLLGVRGEVEAVEEFGFEEELRVVRVGRLDFGCVEGVGFDVGDLVDRGGLFFAYGFEELVFVVDCLFGGGDWRRFI